MKILMAFLSLLLFAAQLNGQKIIEQYTPQKDSVRIGFGKKDFLPFGDKGYTLVLPDTSNSVSGVLISIEDKKFDLESNGAQQIYPEAVAKNMAVLYISTGIPLDLFFSDKSIRYVDTTIKTVFTKYALANKNIFLLGVNLAGHRALKYLEFCQRNRTSFKPSVKGVIFCDSVLDWVRQWYEAKKGIRDNFSESSVSEGKLITYLLESNLKATPKTSLEKYLEFSPYSYFDEKNRHLKFLKDYAVRAYSEPASHYWIDVKRKTTFDTNFPDMVGVINELKLAGNTKSELVLFNQDKANTDKRNPNYTWGLVDKKELVNWLVAQTN